MLRKINIQLLIMGRKTEIRLSLGEFYLSGFQRF